MLDTNTLHARGCPRGRNDICRMFDRQPAQPRHERTCLRACA